MIRIKPTVRRPWPGDIEAYEALDRHFATVETYPAEDWEDLSDQEQLDLLFGAGARLVPVELLEVNWRGVTAERAIATARIAPAIVRRHRQGKSVLSIARHFRISRGAITRILREAGYAPSRKH